MQSESPLHLAAKFNQVEAVVALVEADRPGVVDAVRAAVCCRRSALVCISDRVGVVRINQLPTPPAAFPFTVTSDSPSPFNIVSLQIFIIYIYIITRYLYLSIYLYDICKVDARNEGGRESARVCERGTA